MDGATGASRAIGVGWAPRRICVVWARRDTGPTRTASVRWKWNNEWAARSAPKPATSSRPSPETRPRLATARVHRGMGHGLHWILDMAFGVDEIRVHTRPTPATGACCDTWRSTGSPAEHHRQDRRGHPAPQGRPQSCLQRDQAGPHPAGCCKTPSAQMPVLRNRGWCLVRSTEPLSLFALIGDSPGQRTPTQQAVCQSMMRHDLCLLTARWPSPLKQHAVSVDVTIQIVENQFLLPFSYPPRTRRVPTTYPPCTRDVPTTYPPCTHDVPVACPDPCITAWHRPRPAPFQPSLRGGGANCLWFGNIGWNATMNSRPLARTLSRTIPEPG